MASPSTQFFQSSQDLTGVTNVTAAQLNNILLAGFPFTDKGMIIWTTDVAGNPVVPDPTSTPIFANCLWGRIQPTTNLVIIYFWNPNGASIPTYAQWQSLFQGAIGQGSITGSQIAAQTITAANIANNTLTSAQIALATIVAANIANATITGTQIANGTITAANIGSAVITGANIAPNTIQGSNITNVDANGISDSNVKSIAQSGGGLNPVGVTGKLQLPAGAAFGDILRVNSAATQWEAVLNLLIKSNIFNALGTAHQQIRVNAGVTDFEYFTPPGIGANSFQTQTLDVFSTSGSAVGNFNHPQTLGVTPTYIKPVVVCVGNDSNTGYSAGDEFDLNNIFSAPSGSAPFDTPSGFGTYANSTNVGVNFIPVASSTSLRFITKLGTGAAAPSGYANFAIKVYYAA